MKKNFLVTTSITETWEFNENNFLLGKWCEFYEFEDFGKKGLKEKISKVNITKNSYHWENKEKKIKDYEYVKEKLEYLLEVISEKLSLIHDVKEDKEYWRVIISNWLSQYITVFFDRWEMIRTFFEKNKTEKFYSNYILFDDLNFISKNHIDFVKNVQKEEWNHWVFFRILNYLNIPNLSLIEKKFTKKDFNNKHDLSGSINAIKIVDNLISKLAFKFNKVIFESFYFPKKEYLKICLRCNLIPSRYSNFFNFNIKENTKSKNNIRHRLKDLLIKTNHQDKFIQFLLMNIHKDIPQSYLENFKLIKRKVLPFAKRKKVIFSMHSLINEDNFKIYIAETKKVGSKYIHAVHGGGLTYDMDPRFNYFEKVSDKIIKWDNTGKKKDNFLNLSPTMPFIKSKNTSKGNYCSILFVEYIKYAVKFTPGPGLNENVDLFNKLTSFVGKLKPEIKSKIKFRTKLNLGYNTERRFAEIFGKENIDKVSTKNPLNKTISKSKLIIVTYPQTAFSEAMYSNIPTILIINKNQWQFSSGAEKTFNDLKNNKIAFDDFDGANSHINKYWDELDTWWRSENVQIARKGFLKNFFNVKSNWQTEWSDYVYSTSFFR